MRSKWVDGSRIKYYKWGRDSARLRVNDKVDSERSEHNGPQSVSYLQPHWRECNQRLDPGNRHEDNSNDNKKLRKKSKIYKGGRGKPKINSRTDCEGIRITPSN